MTVPIELLKKPTHYKRWVLCVFTVILYLDWIFHASMSDFSGKIILKTLTRYILLFTFGELIIRLSQLIEYLLKFKLESKTTIVSILKKIFIFEAEAKFAIVITVFPLYYFGISEIFSKDIYYIPILAAYLYIKAFKYDKSTYTQTLFIENSKGLDHGSGMAYNYFFGYLRIILPNKGDNNFSIKDFMKRYENDEKNKMNKVKFSKYKLFILVNRKLYCPPDLSTFSKNQNVILEPWETYLEIIRDRAGVQRRSYKNSVYKIQRIGECEPNYIAVEGANPLLTYYETLKNSGDRQKYFKTNTDEIVKQFYHTLKGLIENSEECRDLCELVYFDSDSTPNIGDILLEKIER